MNDIGVQVDEAEKDNRRAVNDHRTVERFKEKNESSVALAFRSLFMTKHILRLRVKTDSTLAAQVRFDD